MKSNYTIQVGDKTIALNLYQYDDVDEIDVDKLLLIDHANILAEIITFPVILNRFGLLLAEVDNKHSVSELDCKVYKAQKRKDIRKKFELYKKKYTQDIVDDEYRSDAVYRAKQLKTISLKKKHGIMNSIYWSLKDKSDKLNKISDKIQPGDMDWDKIAKKFNGVNIKVLTRLIK